MSRPTHTVGRWVGLLAGALTAAQVAAIDVVELRGSSRGLEGQITLIGSAGVAITVAPGVQGPAQRLVGWDRIRRVTGAGESQAAAFAELADGLWRARARLERGDQRAAELIFDALYARHGGLPGPSGAVLAEGVLRTRLARGAMATAVWPWLDWVQIQYSTGKRDSESWVGGVIALPEVVDGPRRLVPRLPPIFSTLIDPAGVRLLADAAPWNRFDGADEAVADLAAFYRVAAAFEENPSAAITLPARRTTEDQVVLIADIVEARCGGESARAEARSRLVRRLGMLSITPDDLSGEGETAGGGTTGRYLEAWCRVGLGRSLLREAGAGDVRRGVIQMLHAPARFGDVTPELAHLALLDAADAMARLGDPAAAKALRDEAHQRFGSTTDDPWPSLNLSPAGEDAPDDEHDEGAG